VTGPAPRAVPGPGAAASADTTADTTAATTAVAQAVARLDGLEARPVAEHVAVLDEVHRALQDALATLDGA
jgi:hypothetical protein